MISMTIHPLAAKPPPQQLLINAGNLRREYHARKPDFTDGAQPVGFGTSGHRGSSLHGSFNETHILAITQAICDCRSSHGITGPLYISCSAKKRAPARAARQRKGSGNFLSGWRC
jgi:phosphoglucomutase